MRLIVPGDEVDHGNIPLLAVPMTAPDALFNALRIPGQVIVDNCLAKLQVQPFRARLGADQNLRTGAELVHKCEPHSHLAARLSSRRKTGALLLLPPRKCLAGTLVIVDAAK